MSEYKDNQTVMFIMDFLNYSVILVTLVYKLPQMFAVFSARSSAGISLSSLCLEFYSYSVETTYQIAMGYPLETFAEIIPMWGADVILIATVLWDRNLVDKRTPFYIIFYSLCFYAVITRSFADIFMYILMSSTVPLLVLSKADQLLTVLTTGRPGSLSALTWGLLAYCAGARVPTQYLLAYDLPKLVNTSAATVLDVAVTASIVYYNRSPAHTTEINPTREAKNLYRPPAYELTKQAKNKRMIL